MDFSRVLHTAQKNEKNCKKEPIRCYSTKFEPPKKEQRTKTLSANIQKFLARKEEEERRKNKEANKKRGELLALRAQDKKATRRVSVMLKRTKSANQSVIQDAVDEDNTAVTLAGPSQPDEDDYGYVSQEASAFYNKMMEKYSKMPDEPKFKLDNKKKVSTNLSNTKDRVRAALEREKEEAMMPHKRKRKHKDSDSHSQDDYEKEVVYKEEPLDKPKPKPKPPPPVMNFADLLKIAEKKQFEPIVIEQKQKKGEERLLTKKQKKDYEREKEWRDRKEGKIPPTTPSDKPLKQNVPSNSNRIPKMNASTNSSNNCDLNKLPHPNIKSNSSSRPENDRVRKPEPPYDKFKKPDIPKADLDKYRRPNSSKSEKRPDNFEDKGRRPDFSNNGKRPEQQSSSNGYRKIESGPDKKYLYDRKSLPLDSNKNASNKSSFNTNSSDILREQLLKRRELENRKSQPSSSSSSGEKLRNLQPKDLKDKRPMLSDKSKNILPKQFPPKDLKPKQFPPTDLKPKQFPPRDLKPKQFPPPDVRRKEFPPKDVKRKPPITNKRRILDDDSEYDSELDDFIDDGPEEEEDYSKYISEIFGYDKSRYRNLEDDIDNMESTFAQQMREEVISTKIGIMEDLEDMRMEEEEKRRKGKLKKGKV